jgi:hypothetical protein
MVASSECLNYCNEPWNNKNLYETYGPYIYSQFKDSIVYNVGTLAGKTEYMRDLTLNIFLSATNRPVPVVDQSVFNMLINLHPYKDIFRFASQSDAWACQAGTTADPSKLALFKPFLLEDEPVFKDGKVYTSAGEEFVIVHQYNRVPEWKPIVEKLYS